jgi:hypothetical protein
MDQTTATAQQFVATEPSIAGTPLYFTGSKSFDLVGSPYACHAKRFDSVAAAEAAIGPWNRLFHSFTVSPAPAEAAA